MNKNSIMCFLLCSGIVVSLHASAPGTLDTTFNPSGTPPGTVITSVGFFSEARAVAIQQNGKIVVAGQGQAGLQNVFAVARYNSDGSLDTSFNGTGTVTTPLGLYADGRAVAIQSDGKIVVAGMVDEGTGSEFAVVRYNTNGTLDTTFNGTGSVFTLIGNSSEGNAVAIQSDGKIVVAGFSLDAGIERFAVARYNTDGTLDTTFNNSGTPPGTVVTTIGTTATGRSVALQQDGKIVVAGQSDNQFAVARYNTDGTLDTTFNGTGTVITSLSFFNDGRAVAIQQDGKIVVAGAVPNGIDEGFAIAVIRYNTDGSLDTTFNGTGSVITLVGTSSEGNAVTIQQNGKIVVAGVADVVTNQFAVVRYLSDGTLDATFNSGGTPPGTVTTAIGTNDRGNGVALQKDGKIVVAGFATEDDSPHQFAVARYNGDPVIPDVNACALRLINKYGPRL